MKKLELKHLVGYLPYGLKFDGKRNGWVNFDGNIKTLCPIDLDGRWEIIKPILLPLSDLTKEIEINGEKFVPMEELFNIALKDIKKEVKEKTYFDKNKVCYSAVFKTKKGCLSFSFDHTDNSFIMINDGKTVCVPHQLELFDKLLEWHFDIYGLIEAGLAIDINNLNKQL